MAEKQRGLMAAQAPQVWDGTGLLRDGLKLSHLRMMAAIGELGRISAAASVLNISQPAASRMVAEMERILKVPLVTRLPKGISLTPYGLAFARRARAVLLELRTADQEITDLSTGHGGTVHIGAVTGPAIKLAVPAIAKARATRPNIQVNVEVDTSDALVAALLAGHYDFIIGRIPHRIDPRHFESHEISVEEACLIVRKGHPLLNDDPVMLEDTIDFDWVVQPVGTLLRRTVETKFIERGVRLPSRLLNTSSILLTLVVVGQTDAIAPIARDVADFLVGSEGLAGAVAILPIDFDIHVAPFSLILAGNRSLSPTAQLLYDLILQEAG